MYQLQRIESSHDQRQISLSRNNDLFNQLEEAKVLCKLDLKSGYYQVRVKNENIHKKIAFRTHMALLISNSSIGSDMNNNCINEFDESSCLLCTLTSP